MCATCDILRGLLIDRGMNPALAMQIGAEVGERVERVGTNAIQSGAKEVKRRSRKASAYNRRYKAAFKKLAPRYKLKSGKWKKNGFKLAVKAAHKLAGGKK